MPSNLDLGEIHAEMSQAAMRERAIRHGRQADVQRDPGSLASFGAVQKLEEPVDELTLQTFACDMVLEAQEIGLKGPRTYSILGWTVELRPSAPAVR